MPDSTLLKIKKNYPFTDLVDPNLICAFSSRSFQNMSLLYGDTGQSLSNRKNFLASLGIDYQGLVCAKQIHSSSVRYVKEEDRGKGALSYEDSIADTDAFVTDKRNLALAVFTADCPSVFLYEPRSFAIGLVHAGWRSTKENITVKAIQLMQKLFYANVPDLHVGFGPAIRSCCYEVSRDSESFFPDSLIKRSGRYYLDLVQINKKQALELGVKESNIFDTGICTSCRNEEFFSYRREGRLCGRTMSVIMLK